MRKPLEDWTPDEHISEACRLLDKTGYIGHHAATGNPPIGVVVAGVHADLAQAKLMLAVVEVRS